MESRLMPGNEMDAPGKSRVRLFPSKVINSTQDVCSTRNVYKRNFSKYYLKKVISKFRGILHLHIVLHTKLSAQKFKGLTTSANLKPKQQTYFCKKKRAAKD